MLGAIVLAAGRSERMGRTKALLPLKDEKGENFLTRIVRLAEASGLDPIRIVVGDDKALIEEALPEFSGMMIHNEEPDLGQLHSLHLGLRALPEAVAGAVVFLVDHPLVRPTTVEVVVETFRSEGKPVVIPTWRGRRGHPVLFGREVFGDLFDAPLEQGARAVVRAKADLVATVAVEDPGILKNIDTREQYGEITGDE